MRTRRSREIPPRLRTAGPAAAYDNRKYPAGCVMSLFLTHILLFGMLAHRLVCRPPGCHSCGWKLEAVKGGAGNPPATHVQVITGLTRPLRGTLLLERSGEAASFQNKGFHCALRLTIRRRRMVRRSLRAESFSKAHVLGKTIKIYFAPGGAKLLQRALLLLRA